MTTTTFQVDGLDGVTFTPTYDAAKSWLVIEGYDRDGDLVSRSAFSVTPDPIPDIAITPEPANDPSISPTDVLTDAVSYTGPGSIEQGG